MSVGYKVASRPSPKVVPAENLGGRPKLFNEPTVRINLSIPETTAKQLRHFAVEEGLSLSQLIDGWVRKAELDYALARGRKALQEGKVISQAEAEKRLAKWG